MNKRTKWIWLSLIILAFFLTRFWVLFWVEDSAQGDETVIAIMALRRLERGEITFYNYGVHYAGGGVIEASLAVIYYMIFGVHAWSFKLSTMTISFLALIATYLFTKFWWGTKPALITGALFALCPPIFTRYNLSPFGGYMTTILFNIMILHMFMVILFGEFEDGKSTWNTKWLEKKLHFREEAER